MDKFNIFKSKKFNFDNFIGVSRNIWKKYQDRYGIVVMIEPYFKSNSSIEKTINEFIEKLYYLSKRYNIIDNKIELYKGLGSTDIRLRLNDIDSQLEPIPSDIKVDMIDEMVNLFSKFNVITNQSIDGITLTFTIQIK